MTRKKGAAGLLVLPSLRVPATMDEFGRKGVATIRRRLMCASAALLLLAACMLVLVFSPGGLPADPRLARLIMAALGIGALLAAWVFVSVVVHPRAGVVVPDTADGARAPGAAKPSAGTITALERLAGGVAHDLNNILLVLRGYADLAIAEENSPAPVIRHLHELAAGLRRGSELVAQLFAVAQRSSTPLLPIDLNDAVAHALAVETSPAAARVSFAPRAGLPRVKAAGELISILVSNLCAYAAQATPPEAVLAVETGLAEPVPGERNGSGERRVVLGLSCPGALLSEEDRRHVFEPFYTLASGGRRLGLGLAGARGIAIFLGGEIEVRELSSGGSEFRVYFPAAAAEPAALPAHGGATILLAEDDRSIRDLAERILTREGYSVLAAGDGEEALRLFAANSASIRLALLDDVMPKLGGREVLERIRKSSPALPVILCTGYGWGSEDSPAAGGTAELLSKPWQPREMLQRVRRLLG